MKPEKKESTPAAVAAPASKEAPAAESKDAPAAAGKGGAAIMLTAGPGAGMRRLDYIRQEFGKGRKRGEIAKELGVAYQIVFAATKGHAAPAAPAAEAETKAA